MTTGPGDPQAPRAAARRAAARLSGLNADLPAALDRALAGPDAPRRRHVFDAGLALSLASFLLGLVQFGWTVAQDRKRQKGAKDDLIRRMRERIEAADVDDLLSPDQRERVLLVVAEEILGDAE